VRTEDYHYYSQVCLTFGIILIIIGFILPISTINRLFLSLGFWQEGIPYLGHGIALVIVGILLIVFSNILSREYNMRIEEKSKEKGEKAPEEFQKEEFKFCMHCGERISRDAMFCSKCGKKQG